ncbi:MAG: sugar phosphate nucleotidyltransferase [bacterium]
MSSILAMILAGGEGTRLDPLTRHRAKPAVPFGGKYRIIDLVLSNFINSGIYNIAVVTQFKAESLIDHVEEGWQRAMGGIAGHITINPAQQRVHKDWYLGTADAVYQNFNRIEKVDPDILAVFGGDHIYKMNINDMIVNQQLRGADMTIAAIPVPVEKAARQYGVIMVDEDYNLVGFQEKPEVPEPLPHDSSRCLVSMGNYLFNRDLLNYCFQEDAQKEYVSKSKLNSLLEFDPYAQEKYSTHDIGYDIIPFLHRSGLRILVYDFAQNQVPGVTGQEKGYWRDVGTLEEFYESNMDICGITPVFNLYNQEWPIRTSTHNFAPAKFSLSSEVYNSVIGEGSIITRGRVINSVLGYDTRCEKGSEVEFSVLFNGVSIGPGAKVQRAIIDKYVQVPPGVSIGYDPEEDKDRGLITTPSGITVVPKRHVFK